MSGKRGAEKQLTDRNWDRDDDEEEGGEGGAMAVAPAAEIATRKIRGLPNRKGTPGAIAVPSPAAEPKPSAFGASSGFGGFGPITSPASPTVVPFATGAPTFSFGAPAQAAPSTISNPFATTTPFSFPQAAPSTASAPTPPANTFPGSTSFSFPTKPAESTTPPALTYYMSLRALNIALIDSLKAEIEKDPFVDLGGEEGLGKWRAKYEEHRSKVQSVFDAAGGKKGAPTNGAAKPITTPAPTPQAPEVEESKGFKPPAPPAAFSFGGATIKPTSTPVSPPSSSAPVGFIPNFSAPPEPYAEKSAFSFPTSAAVPSTASSPAPVSTPEAAPKSPAMSKTPSASTVPPKPSPLRFGENASSPSSLSQSSEVEPPKDKPASKFSFGSTFGALAKGKPDEASPAFGSAAQPVPSPSNLPPPTFSFGPSTTAPSLPASTPALSLGVSSPFGTSSATISPPKAPAKFAPSSPPITSTFGGTSPTFGFGAAIGGTKPKTNTPGFSFGTTTSSEPKKVTAGFSFGASATPPTGGSAFGGFGNAPTSTGFSFGSNPAPEATTEVLKPTSVVEPTQPTSTLTSTESSTPATGSTTPVVSEETNEVEGAERDPFGGRGAGEEEEEVLYTLEKAKIWVLDQADWVLKGVCKLEIKENAKEGWKRVLGRNIVNGTLPVNFRLTAEQSFPTKEDTPKFMFFTVPYEGELKNYRLQVKTQEMRDGLAAALDKEKV